MIKLLICDDSVEITEQVASLVSEFEKKHKIKFNITVSNSAADATHSGESYDIAIVDVEMPEVDGIELSKKLKAVNPDIIVIILTSYQNYLDSAMKIRIFRYLSKPIDEARFFLNLKDAVSEHRRISKTITVSSGDEVHLLRTKDILFVENQKYGSVIHSKRGDFKTNKKPHEILQLTGQENCFVFSHNSILVNLQNVIDFDKTGIVLRKNESETVTTYISQRKYSDFKKAFFNFAGGLK